MISRKALNDAKNSEILLKGLIESRQIYINNLPEGRLRYRLQKEIDIIQSYRRSINAIFRELQENQKDAILELLDINKDTYKILESIILKS